MTHGTLWGALAAALLTAGLAGADETCGSRLRSEIRLSAKDRETGFNFERYPDGRVELTAIEEQADGRKQQVTYRSNSMGELIAKYPELRPRYRLDRFETPREVSNSRDAVGRIRYLIAEENALLANEDAQFEEEGFGILADDVDGQLAADLGIRDREGVEITGVAPGSVAEAAGLLRSDVVLSINGIPIHDSEVLVCITRLELANGFQLQVVRGTKTLTIPVKARFVFQDEN